VRDRRGVRQFVKFAIVGASSTFIDIGLHWLLFKYVDGQLNESIRNAFFNFIPSLRNSSLDPAFILIKGFSFVAATFNGFYWNRRWTFRMDDPDLIHKQLIRFYIVYIVGLGINTTVAALIYHRGEGKLVYLLSLVVATIVTTAWTFPMNKFWTFKPASK
jgi:putative flippase GtrA